MQDFGRCNPELRELVVGASLALARLDADRLDQLALTCQALNHDLALVGEGKRDMERQAREALAEMAVLGRVLEATRSNLEVMNRLRELRRGRQGYAGWPLKGSAGPWARAEKFDGND